MTRARTEAGCGDEKGRSARDAGEVVNPVPGGDERLDRERART